jgi:hypothetical protein
MSPKFEGTERRRWSVLDRRILASIGLEDYVFDRPADRYIRSFRNLHGAYQLVGRVYKAQETGGKHPTQIAGAERQADSTQ